MRKLENVGEFEDQSQCIVTKKKRVEVEMDVILSWETRATFCD